MLYKKITSELQSLLKSIYKPGDLIISYKESGIPGQMTPFFIRSKEKIDLIEITPYCINNLAVYLAELSLLELFAQNKNAKIIITVKPCDMNSIMQMVSDAQIALEKLSLVVFECDGTISVKNIKDSIMDDFSDIELAESSINLTTINHGKMTLKKDDFVLSKCKDKNNCSLSSFHDFYFVGVEAKKPLQGKKQIKEETLLQDSLTKKDLKKAVETELAKCIRCNACRNICPACFCSDQCIMDKPKLVAPFIEKGTSLANNTLYHLIRFFHIAPNCTSCGECERVCPQNIRLSIFYKYLNRFTEKELGYIPGKSDQERQKLLNYRFGEDLV